MELIAYVLVLFNCENNICSPHDQSFYLQGRSPELFRQQHCVLFAGTNVFEPNFKVTYTFKKMEIYLNKDRDSEIKIKLLVVVNIWVETHNKVLNATYKSTLNWQSLMQKKESTEY